MYQVNKTLKKIAVDTKYTCTCHFTLEPDCFFLKKYQMENAKNISSKPLDFKIFLGGPQAGSSRHSLSEAPQQKIPSTIPVF